MFPCIFSRDVADPCAAELFEKTPTEVGKQAVHMYQPLGAIPPCADVSPNRIYKAPPIKDITPHSRSVNGFVYTEVALI